MQPNSNSSDTKQSRRLLRFSLRTMLILMTILASVLAILVRPVFRHVQAMEVLRNHASDRSLRYDVVPLTDLEQPEHTRQYWRLVQSVMGKDAIATAIGWVDFTWVEEEELRAQLLEMPNLKVVNFRNVRMNTAELLKATNETKTKKQE